MLSLFGHRVFKGLEFLHIAEFLINLPHSHILLFVLSAYASSSGATLLALVGGFVIGAAAFAKVRPAPKNSSSEPVRREHATLLERRFQLPDGTEAEERIIEWHRET